MDVIPREYPRVAIVSSCPEAWGGSEELWAGAARLLISWGHEVHVLKIRAQAGHSRLSELQKTGGRFTNLSAPIPFGMRLLNRVRRHHQQFSVYQQEEKVLAAELKSFGPQLTIISQGSNFDGLYLADVCRKAGYPYVLVVQKAVEFFFPWGADREMFRRVYQAARHCFFVSHHNLRCTEQQLGMALPQTSVVANPFNVPLDALSPFPPAQPTLHLACVARLYLLDKGQDLLLRVLAQDRWRSRPVHVTFYGAGGDQPAMQELADFLELTSITFGGHVSDIAALWARHHALVLPSRSEGLPLALVEAMLCGRPAIATNVGGMAEMLRDNETGFLAAAATVEAFDEALERAWQRRGEWAAIGQAAARHARATVPPDPAAEFIRQVLAL